MGSSTDVQEIVELQVMTLDGNTCAISCPGDATLQSLLPQIVSAIGKPDEEHHLRFVREGNDDDSEACVLDGDTLAADVHGHSIRAVLVSEPEWCTGKRFQRYYIRGRRGGAEEESEDEVLDLHRGGAFRYVCSKHDHDAECRTSYDCKNSASGHWQVEVVDGQERAELVVLTGISVKSETWRRRSNTKEATENSKFRMSFAQVDLLNNKVDMHKRGGGWKVETV